MFKPCPKHFFYISRKHTSRIETSTEIKTDNVEDQMKTMQTPLKKKTFKTLEAWKSKQNTIINLCDE